MGMNLFCCVEIVLGCTQFQICNPEEEVKELIVLVLLKTVMGKELVSIASAL
jgi:hypothetical protein